MRCSEYRRPVIGAADLEGCGTPTLDKPMKHRHYHRHWRKIMPSACMMPLRRTYLHSAFPGEGGAHRPSQPPAPSAHRAYGGASLPLLKMDDILPDCTVPVTRAVKYARRGSSLWILISDVSRKHASLFLAPRWRQCASHPMPVVL